MSDTTDRLAERLDAMLRAHQELVDRQRRAQEQAERERRETADAFAERVASWVRPAFQTASEVAERYGFSVASEEALEVSEDPPYIHLALRPASEDGSGWWFARASLTYECELDARQVRVRFTVERGDPDGFPISFSDDAMFAFDDWSDAAVEEHVTELVARALGDTVASQEVLPF